MEILSNFVSLFIHLDDHINTIITNYGTWTYLILFIIIFCETGLVVTPFLPGDSLLFVVGALSVSGALNVFSLIIILTLAAILGDSANYFVGKKFAPQIFGKKKIPFLKQEYLDRTHAYFQRYGGKTIIIARFVPIVRTFAPFLAGVGTMTYPKFLAYNIFGAILWVCVGVFSGYFFGNLQFVKDNFTLVILAIIVISLLPAVFEYCRERRKKVTPF